MIKLDAVGDVLRTASILPFIERTHEAPYVAWVTLTESAPLVRSFCGLDEVIELTVPGLARLQTGNWDFVYSLSNDMTSASLATLCGAKNPPIGFHAQSGLLQPSNEAAMHWLSMGAFDRVKRENGRTYQSLMFDIIGASEPVLPPAVRLDGALVDEAKRRVMQLFPDSSRRRIAVNVGSGGRWPKKMIGASQIVDFCHIALEKADADILLVGGAREASKCDDIMKGVGTTARVQSALTPDSVLDFIALLTQVDTLLCGDTLSVHVASSIGLPTVCVFGPTSAAEIPDFDGLVIKTRVEDLDCLSCYGDCTKIDNCMTLLSTNSLVALVLQQLDRAHQTKNERTPSAVHLHQKENLTMLPKS